MGMGLIALDEEPYASLSEPEIQALTIRMFARELKTRRVLGFVGAGMSATAGRPTWNQFVKNLASAVGKASGGKYAQEYIGTILSYAQDKDLPADRLPLVLQACEDWYEAQPAGLDDYRQQVVKALETGRKQEQQPSDALRELIALGVRRFITTNYDDDIEAALRRHAHCTDHKDALGPVLRSFAIGGDDAAEVVQFAVNAPGYRHGVFHCHGQVSKPKSPLIVTTRDYQRFYLGKGHEQSRDRKAMDLMLDANPILFVGYSLSEPDVLRPLREFVAERRPGAPERPLFALLPTPAENEERLLRRRQLYLDYGVKVIWFPLDGVMPAPTQPAQLAKALTTALQSLQRSTQVWWADWRLKPPLRRAQFGRFKDDRWMIRHKEAGHPPHPHGAPESAFDARTEDFREYLMQSDIPLVALGGPGQGKGSLCARLTELWLNERPSGRALSATNHFANDFLSVIEAAALHLGDGGDAKAPPLDRLRSALANRDRLLVIGNFERLLVPRRAMEVEAKSRDGLRASDRWGDPMTPEVREFLDIVAEAKGKVVLTSTLWPSTLAPRPKMIVHLDEIDIMNVTKAFVGAEYACADAAELCQVLGGHAYALAALLAAKNEGGDSWSLWLRSVTSELSIFDPTGRPARAIAMTIERACQHHGSENGRLDVLHCIALTTTPIEQHVIETALRKSAAEVAPVLDELCHLRLLIKIEPPSSGTEADPKPSIRYTAHTLVRTCVLHAAGSYALGTAEPQRFVLPCYSDEGEEIQQTTPAAHRRVTLFVDRMLDRLDKTVAATGASSSSERRQVARAAFGMIRSRWSAVGMSQLAHIEPSGMRGHYEDYQRRLFRLADGIRRGATDGAWRRFDSLEPSSPHGILYADELAWLYNELGLVAFIRGFAGNAQSLWLQGLDVNLAAEAGTQGRRWRQSMLNLAMIQIETGHLIEATVRLDRVLQAARSDGDTPTAARAEGFLGWICHLRGDSTRAHQHYDHAIGELEGTNVQRGKSLFLRYRGDLFRREQRCDEAQNDLRRSRATAEQGRHLDLVQWTHLSEAVLALSRGNADAAIGVERVLAFAVRMGIPKLEAAALQVRAEAALGNGDLGHAEHMTRKALAIAARLGLQLRVILAVFVLGRIARKQHDLENARRLFTMVVNLGRAHGYQLRVDQAEKELQELPGGFALQ